MWIWIVIVVLGLILLGVVAFQLIRIAGRHVDQGHRSGVSRAREILDERYARGEIDDEEYQKRVEGLSRRIER
jgi:putative membrane protein